MCWNSILQGHWCIKCVNEQHRKEIECRIKNIIKSKKGKVEKKFKYVNSYKKFNVTCKKGHSWLTNWAIIRQGSWCPECAGYKIYEKDIVKVIKNKGGTLKKKFKYKKAIAKFLVKCNKNHVWITDWARIRSGHWCPTCSWGKVDKKEVIKLIKEKGGKIDSNFKYSDSQSEFWITCKKGHRWNTCWSNINQGNWCHKCFFLKRRKDEKEVKSIIENKGGKVSEDFKYTGSFDKFWIENCGKGHKFETNWSSVQRGHWCPYCIAKTQDEFRKTIELYFNERFPKTIPKWLLWKKGRRLELDGYNSNLKIAFEYQGYQHYERAHFDGYSLKSFQERCERDIFKIKRCAEEGVLLIIVPYWVLKKDWKPLIESFYINWRKT
jgi:hypothetical protein